MPNHVINKIEFVGEKENIQKIFDLIKGKNGQIDFEKIIPMPENIFRGNLGQKERELYGSDNWYDWSISHWGTKWNAYDIEVNDNILCFNTAWSCPYPILETLAVICDENNVQFKGEWCNEDWASDSGEFETDMGGIYIYEDELEEAHAARCESLWGYNPNEIE